MTANGPVSPSPELVRQWQREADHNKPMFYQVAVMAAHWGYKQRCLEERGETKGWLYSVWAATSRVSHLNL